VIVEDALEEFGWVIGTRCRVRRGVKSGPRKCRHSISGSVSEWGAVEYTRIKERGRKETPTDSDIMICVVWRCLAPAATDDDY
jgi:hypothetical protein